MTKSREMLFVIFSHLIKLHYLDKIIMDVIMLVLTRRAGETLIIGDNIKITILAIKGSQVRVGIDAPKDISIQRSELLDEKLEEGEGINVIAFVK